MIFGQNSYSSSSDVLVSLKTGVVINQINGDLDFGDYVLNKVSNNLTKSPESGVLFEVNGVPRTRVIINYSNNVVLDNSSWISVYGGNLGNIVFTPNVTHTGRRSNYINPRNLRNGRRIRIRNDNGIGRLFLWVGGSLEINQNQPIGTYSGSFNITVAYN